MALFDTTWYCNAGNQSTTGYYAVPQFQASHAYSAGQLIRQLTAPAVGSERVFICIVAGTSGTEPTWTVTRGARNTSTTPVFQECTGASAVNGDQTNTPTWAAAKAISTAVTLGAIIKRNNGASYWICSTAGNSGGSEPAWANDTAGTTQTDSTVTWTCLGVVGNFTGGQAPHARLANACAGTWWVTGNTIYVGDNHAESQTTALSITPTLSQATVSKIICHNHSGSYPPTSANLAATATISTTAAVALNVNPTLGTLYVYGLTFAVGVGVSTAAVLTLGGGNGVYFYDSCIFKVATTGVTALAMDGAGAAGYMFWNNCQVSFANIGQTLATNYLNFIWQNTGQVLASGSTVPTNFFGNTAAGFIANVTLEALDLSQITSLFSTAFAMVGNWVIKDCKLNASITFPNPVSPGLTVQYVRSDDVATAYQSARYVYEGTETTETSITRVGGASDPTGQAQSRKIATTANAQWLRPFRAEPYAIWNPRTAANVTVTVCGIINTGTLPNNDDVWMDVEYLGSSSFPIGTIVNTTKANLFAANAAVASDSSTWNNTPAPAFDPASISNVTLTNSNLTATHSNTTIPGGAQALAPQVAGKWYFEITQTTTPHGTADVVAGLYPVPVNLGNTSNGTGGVSVLSGNGAIWISSVNTVLLGAFAAGDVCGVAVDFTAGLFWARKNAGNWNNSGTANPATGAGGLAIVSSAPWAPVVVFNGSGSQAGDSYTANFGATSYANTAPSGFNNLVAWTPFKLTTTLSSPQPGMAGYIHARVRAAKALTTYYIDPQITLS